MSSNSSDLGPSILFLETRTNESITVPSSKSKTFTGPRANHQLRFREHVKLAIEQGSAWVAVNSLQMEQPIAHLGYGQIGSNEPCGCGVYDMDTVAEGL